MSGVSGNKGDGAPKWSRYIQSMSVEGGAVVLGFVVCKSATDVSADTYSKTLLSAVHGKSLFGQKIHFVKLSLILETASQLQVTVDDDDDDDPSWAQESYHDRNHSLIAGANRTEPLQANLSDSRKGEHPAADGTEAEEEKKKEQYADHHPHKDVESSKPLKEMGGHHGSAPHNISQTGHKGQAQVGSITTEPKKDVSTTWIVAVVGLVVLVLWVFKKWQQTQTTKL